MNACIFTLYAGAENVFRHRIPELADLFRFNSSSMYQRYY